LAVAASYAADSFHTISATNSGLTYDPVANELFYSIPGTVPTIGNSIGSLNPDTLATGTPVFIGSNPGELVDSGDGNFIYAALNGSGAVRQYNIKTASAGVQINLGSGGFGQKYPEDMAVVPGSPGSVAVVQVDHGYSPSFQGITVFDNGVARTNQITSFTGGDSITFASSSTMLAVNDQDTGFDLFTYALNSSGLTQTKDLGGWGGSFGTIIKYGNGHLFTNGGGEYDPSTGQLQGTFNGAGGSFAIDAAKNRVFYLSGNTITGFDENTFLPVGTITVPVSDGSNLVVTNHGLAFSDASAIYVVNTALVPEPASIGVLLAAVTGLLGAKAAARLGSFAFGIRSR
jgi:hypothetical protein